MLAAHADDETLGCGGTIAALAGRGAQVDLCVVTDSTSAQYPDDKEMMARRRSQSAVAAKLLGINAVSYLDFPDMQLDQVPHRTLNDALSEQIRKVRPDTVLTHWEHDLNLDHCAVARSTTVATRLGASGVRRVWAYEVPSSSEWQTSAAFEPTVFFGIGGQLATKLEAFTCYVDEVREFPHPRSAQGIETLARYRGIQSGMQAAEAFRLVKAYEAA